MKIHRRHTHRTQSRRGHALAATVAAVAVFVGCVETPVAVPPGTLHELDRSSYAHRMEVLAHHFPGANRPGKMQMMVIGDRRYLFQIAFPGESWDWLRAEGQIIDVSDPLAPVIVNQEAGGRVLKDRSLSRLLRDDWPGNVGE